MKSWGKVLACAVLGVSLAVPVACDTVRDEISEALVGPPFEPGAVTFVSDAEGWLRGAQGYCGTKCDRLFHTVDGGRNWEPVTAPAFDYEWFGIADARDWFALRWPDTYGAQELELWSSHDGGSHWSRVRLPGDVELPAFGVRAVIADGTVRVVAFDGRTGEVRMVSSPVGADDFTATPRFPVVEGRGRDSSITVDFTVVQAGSTSWFAGVVSTPARGASKWVGARVVDGRWSSFPLPCVSVNRPELAAISATELAISCDPTGEVDSRQGEHHLYVSTDAGDTFTDLGALAPRGKYATLIGAGTTGDLVVAVPTGEPGAPTALRTSHDGGRTWAQTLNPPAPKGMSVSGAPAQGEFFTPATGYARLSYVGEAPDGMDILYLTRDGGDTWDRVALD
ncbi:hypothetical protein ACFYTS_22220 [Nocardia sp. NPDC004151]|uniref:hypothetical protein n=1 Tax=Nocardia sp. NPDC004151 TaxID=3364304 RepID=UPI0036B47F13